MRYLPERVDRISECIAESALTFRLYEATFSLLSTWTGWNSVLQNNVTASSALLKSLNVLDAELAHFLSLFNSFIQKQRRSNSNTRKGMTASLHCPSHIG